MEIAVRPYKKENIPDVVRFEQRLRQEEDFWGWQIDENYMEAVERSFDDPAFDGAISLLAYCGAEVVGRIDAAVIASRFEGKQQAYLDWICVLKSFRHQKVAQQLMAHLRSACKARGIETLVALTAANDEAQRFYRSIENAKMHDTGIWIDIM